MTIQAAQKYEMGTSSARTITIDFTDELDEAEALTGTPTAAELDTADLAPSALSVSVVPRTIYPEGPDGPPRTVAAGKAVVLSLSVLGTAPVALGDVYRAEYKLRITAISDGSPVQTIPCIITVTVIDDTTWVRDC